MALLPTCFMHGFPTHPFTALWIQSQHPNSSVHAGRFPFSGGRGHQKRRSQRSVATARSKIEVDVCPLLPCRLPCSSDDELHRRSFLYTESIGVAKFGAQGRLAARKRWKYPPPPPPPQGRLLQQQRRRRKRPHDLYARRAHAPGADEGAARGGGKGAECVAFEYE